MLSKHNFHLNICYRCQQSFKEKDKIYTIKEMEFEDNLTIPIFSDIKDLYTNSVSVSYLEVPKEIHFHKSCYLDIAGLEYEFEE